jgi:hypothetical protein
VTTNQLVLGGAVPYGRKVRIQSERNASGAAKAAPLTLVGTERRGAATVSTKAVPAWQEPTQVQGVGEE